MKFFFYTVLLLLFPILVQAQTRDCDPVVLTGNEASCMLGEAPTEVVAFRYQSGNWEQIPMQIDERILLDITAPYGEATGDCFYKSREDVPWDVLFYADPNTYTGADVTDLTFDADDELVFMAKDVGSSAPQNACPAGVVATTKCQMSVQDPIDGNSILGYVYLFRQNGGLAQNAGKDYVDYDFDFGENYKDEYDVCVFEVPGSNPESSTLTTDNYSLHFSRRWVKDELNITAGNASGIDILDHHQYFINVNACNRNEVTFSDGKGPIIANIDGPVRAIRSVMGGNSGTFTQLDILFTECRTENTMFYRLHPANGYYDAFDLNSNAIGMTYYNDQNPDGVMIDGQRDNLIDDNPNEWELISGTQGSIAVTYTYETDIMLGTQAEYDAGLVEGFVAAYQSDLGASEPRKCTGDMESYNSSGLCLRTLECTDDRYEFANSPSCLPENVKFFEQVRYHYFLPPQATKAEAAQYASFAKNPLTVQVNAQSCNGNPPPSCIDGIQNGNETGIDCGGPDCPDCPVEPTCDDGIQNGNETGIDCGGPDCPDCPTEPTCTDGVQNGMETGVDCGGPDCLACPTVCAAPMGLFLSNNSSGSTATLNWEAVTAATTYTVNLRPVGTNKWRTGQSSTTSLAASPLRNGTSYEWRVSSNCSGEMSPWSVINIFTAGSGSAPTCTDGIQNGNETGIDCGGPDCPDCPTEPTCDDGIQNGNETGVDCGGPDCPDCPTEPTCDDGIQNGMETGVDCGGPDCPACPVTCDTPTGLETNSVMGKRATLNWNAAANAVSYTIEIRQQGTSNWIERTTTNTFQRVQPLLANTAYEWRVRSNCASGSSTFSSIITFTAAASATPNVESRDQDVKRLPLVAKAYPSPVSDVLTVQVNQAIRSIEILDMMGKTLVLPITESNLNSREVSVETLPSGYYLVRIQANEEVVMLRFVKD